MSILNFDLKLTRDERGDFVEVLSSPAARSNAAPLRLPADVHRRVAALRERGSTEADCAALGRDLFESLFPRDVLERWIWSKQLVDGRGQILRLRLDIRSPALAALPWELICEGSVFLALVPSFPVVRYNCGRPEHRPSRSLERPNVLIAVATPSALPPLAAQEEAEVVRASLLPLLATDQLGRIDVLQHATPDRLETALRAGCHVLHYIGHGVYDEHEQTGCLLLEDEAGGPLRVSAAWLGQMLAEPKPRLLVLNSCETAVPSPADPLLGVAQAALEVGVPAVIAVQGRIKDDVAGLFAKELYGRLADGEPLERCMVTARRAITGRRGSLAGVEWATPVLFSNVADGSLWRPRQKARRRTGPVLHNVTDPDFDRLVGRERELETAIDALSSRAPGSIVTLTGDPGVGRTAFAKEVAQRYRKLSSRRRLADAFYSIVWVSAQPTMLSSHVVAGTSTEWRLDDLLVTVASVLGKDFLIREAPQTRRHIVQYLLGQERHLLILDDADKMGDTELLVFLRQLPPPTKAIVICERAFPGLPALVIQLKRLSLAAATELVRRDAAAEQVTTVERASSVDIRELARKAEGLPLVLRMAVTSMAGSDEPISSTLERIERTGGQPLAPSYVERLVHDLAPEERRGLLAFAIFPKPTRCEAAGEVAALPAEDFRRALERLVQLRLLEPDPATGLHRLRFEAQRHALRDVDADLRRSLIRTATESLSRFAADHSQEGDAAKLERLKLEVGNLLWAVRQASREGEWRKVLRFRQPLGDFLYWTGYWNAAIEVGELGFAAAEREGDLEHGAWCALYPLGHVHFHRGDFAAARRWCERGLAIFADLRHGRGQADAERNLGRVLQAQGDMEGARALFIAGLERARSFAEGPADQKRQANLLASLAGLAEEQGRYEEARASYGEALAIYRETGAAMGIAATLHRLGSVELCLGRDDEAARLLDESLAAARACGWENRATEIIYALALLAERRGELELAQERLDAAREQFLGRSAMADVARTDAALARVEAALRFRETRSMSEKGSYLGTLSTDDRLYGFLCHRVLSERMGVVAARPEFEVYGLGSARRLDSDESKPAVFRYVERRLGIELVGKFYGDRWVPGWTSKDDGFLAGLMRAELANLERLRSLGFDRFPHRVVRPWAADESINCVLVEEYIPGADLETFIHEAVVSRDNGRLRPRLARVASFLADLHDRTATGETVEPDDAFAYYRRVCGQLLEAGIVDAGRHAWLESLGERWRHSGSFESAARVLVHGDAMPAHFIFNGEDDLTVIDLERLAPGDRAVDLGRMAAELDHALLGRGAEASADMLVEELFAGYLKCVDQPLADADALLRRARFHMGCDELRISRNRWLDLSYRQRLAERAAERLEALVPA